MDNLLCLQFDEAQLCNDDDDEDMLDYGSEADRSNLEDVVGSPLLVKIATHCLKSSFVKFLNLDI